MSPHSPLASIDIGSNSVLLLVGRMHQGKLQIQRQRKETIRLGGALDAQGQLEAAAMERGLQCLRRYAELIRDIPSSHRRAVATQTLREASNRDTFLQAASEILQCRVELISGEQEARWIYQGVTALLPEQPEQRLVIDIGGRSTEICVGEGHTLHSAASYAVGSVAWAQRFFPNGSLAASDFAQAIQAAQQVLQPALEQLRTHAWQQVYGSSGTAGAISKALHHMGEPPGLITRPALLQLQQQLVQAGHIDRLPLAGLRDDIKPVIGGGVSLMCAVFQLFGIEQLRVTQGSLRHGLLLSTAQELSLI